LVQPRPNADDPARILDARADPQTLLQDAAAVEPVRIFGVAIFADQSSVRD
jgi:hypothetical protein